MAARFNPYDADSAPAGKKPAAEMTTTSGPGISPSKAALTAKATVHEMSPLRMETRDLTEDVPPEGCSTAQLRDFVVGKFQTNAKNLRDFEAMITEKFHNIDRANADAGARIQALDPLLPHVRDLGVFDQMKVLVKQEEFKSRNDEIQQALQKLNEHLQENFDKNKVAEMERDIVLMKEKIDGYVFKVEEVENEFKGHVGKAFSIVEEECMNIKKVIEVTNANLQENTGTSNAVTQLQLGAIQNRVQTLEAKSASAQENAGTSNAVTQIQLGALQDRVQTLEANTKEDFILNKTPTSRASCTTTVS